MTMAAATATVRGMGRRSPSPMTFPLLALAVGASWPAFSVFRGAGGCEHDRAFPRAELYGAARRSVVGTGAGRRARRRTRRSPPQERHQSEEKPEEPPEVPRSVELGLMAFSRPRSPSIGIALAWKFYVTSPEISERLAAAVGRRASDALEQVLRRRAVQRDGRSRGRSRSGRGLWTFDRNVVDGAVNGTSWVTRRRRVVLGPDRSHGRRRPRRTSSAGSCEEGSFWFREAADRTGAELRAVDAVRRLCVPDGVSVRAVTRIAHRGRQTAEPVLGVLGVLGG